ncbi:MAG: amidohydrolase [Pseudomonadota bacterium]
MIHPKCRILVGKTGLLLLAIVVAGCSSSGSNDSAESSASALKLFTGGVIYTAMEGRFAEAFAVHDGEIIAVGNNAEIQALNEAGAKRIDLKGRLVLPGLHDSHVHILEASSPLSGTCMLDAGKTPEALIGALRACAPKQRVLDWVLGFGWDIGSFLASNEDPLAAIDAAIPDRPAAIMEQTSHAVWVNSRALEALSITAESENPAGGVIAKNANGLPNGLLIDNAGDLAFEVALSRTPAVDEQHLQGLYYGLSQLASNGITSFADARAYWTRGFHEFYDAAELQEGLTARAVLGLWAYPQMDDSVQLARLKSLFRRDDARLVQRTQIKVYVDGITQNTTARTLRPYLVDYGFGTPKGLNYFTEDRLTKYISELERVGYDFHIHAIGAGGVREALNAIERARAENPQIADARHRITHVEHVHPDDIARFAELGVIADIQLAGEFTDPDLFAEYNDPLIGEDNPVLPLPARALLDAGAILSLSSDFDVSPLNPFLGIANAVNRHEGALSVQEAVDAYTINAAFLMRHENRLGSIESGKRADFVVLDQNVFAVTPDVIADTQVLLTVIDGEEVFRSRAY